MPLLTITINRIFIEICQSLPTNLIKLQPQTENKIIRNYNPLQNECVRDLHYHKHGFSGHT